MTLCAEDKKAFNAALFWANKPIKKFVATLLCRKSGQTEARIFAAGCSDRASELALATTDLADAVVREIRLATPEDLGVAPTAVAAPLQPLHFGYDKGKGDDITLQPLHSRMPGRVTAMAEANGLKQFAVPGGSPDMYLLGNATAIAAVQRLQQQHQRLTAALADCLAMMQRAEQHRKHPTEWNDPVGIAAWDVAATAGQLVLREAVCKQ